MTSPDTTTSATETTSPSIASTSPESAKTASGSTDSLISHDLAMEKAAMRRAKGRENVKDKAMRLLTSGRLRVLRVDSDFITAECRGDSGEVYNLLWRDQRWSCSCPARSDCSHLRALWAVVAVSR